MSVAIVCMVNQTAVDFENVITSDNLTISNDTESTCLASVSSNSRVSMLYRVLPIHFTFKIKCVHSITV